MVNYKELWELPDTGNSFISFFPHENSSFQYSPMYAISTHCLSRISLSEAFDTLSLHTGNVEIMSDGLHYLTDTEIPESYSFAYSLHAPARGVNIASVLEPIRRASVEVTAAAFALAADLNAPVVVHPGYYAWEDDYERAALQLRSSLKELHETADQAGVTFFLENMGDWGHFFLKSPEDLSLTGDTGFCLDTGHAGQCRNLAAFLEVPFSHVHLHDNDGTADSHAAIGEGTIDFDAVMAAVRKNRVSCPVIETETLAGALSSLEILRDRYGG
jgi:sugar phosphate isomerase/epimerase